MRVNNAINTTCRTVLTPHDCRVRCHVSIAPAGAGSAVTAAPPTGILAPQANRVESAFAVYFANNNI
ncbi:hypothetical protein L596_002084 [Steinernema carpocapsae]|uniref:Uncharacterized protein n=1 Tax=Steinernema carpocapsae TaxID=34508 RepID=A0A4U8UQ69_STECR|nr:hypothetical protein L596_002084 [Steinernema carpocapsae]